MAGVCRSISKNVGLILIIYLSFGGTSIGYCKSLSFAARENYFAFQILVANDKHATTEGREGGGGGGHNPISHQKFFENPSPSWIFIKNPSRSYQNPSE